MPSKLHALANYLSVFSDLRSVMIARNLLRSGDVPQDGRIAVLRIRALHGKPIACRYGTSDFGVVWDTFQSQYHCPPAGIGEIRSILDLGSNIGTTVAHFGELYPKAKVIGVELEPRNWELCSRNIEPFKDRCHVLLGAAWTEDGFVGIQGDSAWGYQATQTDKTEQGVPAYSVDTLIAKLGVNSVDYLKMDIEGAEKDILRRPESWIGKVRCLKVEVHEPYTVEDCTTDLVKHGFKCFPDEKHPHCVVAVRA